MASMPTWCFPALPKWPGQAGRALRGESRLSAPVTTLLWPVWGEEKCKSYQEWGPEMIGKIDVRRFPDNARLQLIPQRSPSTKIRHNKRHAQCLAWVMQSRTMGDYRSIRRTAGLTPNGGYLGYFIKSGILRIEMPKGAK